MIKRNMIANILGQGWGAAAGLLFVPLYVHYLGLEAYGLVGLVAVLRMWLSQFDVGITPTLNREMARFTAGAHTPESIHDLLRSLTITCFTTAVGIFAVVWLASDYLAHDWVRAKVLAPSEISSSIKIAAALLSFQFCEGIYRGSLIGLQQQISSNVVTIVSTTVRHVGAWVVLAFASPTIHAFLAWNCLTSILTVASLAIILHLKLPRPARRPHFSMPAIRAVWRFSAGMLSITTLSILLMQVDKVLLSRLLTLEEFGLYTLVSAATGILGIAASPILQAFYPRVVQLVTRKDEPSLARAYHLSAQVVTAVSAPILVLLVFYPDGVFYAWTNDWDTARSARPLVMVLALGTFANTVMRPSYEFMLAHGWTSLSVKVNIIAVLLVIPALLFLVPLYGALGAAYIWLALNVSYIWITIPLMHRRILHGQSLSWYLNDLIFPIFCGALGGLLWTHGAPSHTAGRLHWAIFLMAVGLTTLCTTVAGSSELRLRVHAFIRSRAI